MAYLSNCLIYIWLMDNGQLGVVEFGLCIFELIMSYNIKHTYIEEKFKMLNGSKTDS